MEDFLKKKLQTFIYEMFKVGTVKGFKLFSMYVRGKEELVISILNEPLELHYDYSSGGGGTPLNLSAASQMSWAASSSFTSANLPYDKRSLMISQRSQKKLSGYGSIGVGLPPASPSEKETMETDENSTLFLLASYGRYNCPYVWVRSNHHRLIKLLGDKDKDKDNPLNLKSTSNWTEKDIKPWDVIGELVKLNTYPPPRNPFEIDFDYFDTIHDAEILTSTGAMMHFLQKVILMDKEDRYYTAKVLEDLERLTKLHFQQLAKVSKDPSSRFAQSGNQSPQSVFHKTDISDRRRTSSSGSGGRYPSQAYQAYR